MKPAQLYRRLAELPTYVAASFLGPNVLRVVTSVRDHSNNRKRTIIKTIAFPLGEGEPVITSQEQAESVIASTVSRSGTRIAILKESKEADKVKRQVEIWRGSTAEAILDVTKEHGEFYGDDTFSSLSFSPSESSLLYTAEENPPGDAPNDPFRKYRFEPTLGERFVGRKRPALFLAKWGDSEVVHRVRITNPDETQSLCPPYLGPSTFSSNSEDELIALQYHMQRDGRKLGTVYCTNRSSSTIKLTLCANDDNVSATADVLFSGRPSRSPRVLLTEDGRKRLAVWLSYCHEPHGSCASLHVTDFSSEPETIVRTVAKPGGAKEFPGLYLDQLPPAPFVEYKGRPSVVTHSAWGSRKTVLLIDLEQGSIVDLTPDAGELWSWTVLACDGKDQIVASRASPTSPQELVVGRLKLGGGGHLSHAKWTVVGEPDLEESIRDLLQELEAKIVPVPNRSPTETIVLSSKEVAPRSVKSPLITFPHGGPHAVMTTDFNPGLAVMALHGYTVSMVNYTGSLGFGQDWVEALLGRCGELDVGDVIASAKHLVDLGIAEEGKGKQFVSGGSHGGFLSAHLIGQYRDFFSAAVMRNPVINIGSMFATTDIPDWCTVECGVPYAPDLVVTPTLYKKLYDASPIAHIANVRTPVLLLIGDVDQRVPPSQGRDYYHALKALGKEVEMLWFPENNHSLDKVEAEKVGWEAQWEWFEKRKAV